MSLFESIILGIVQGLTEFLPVSSSGHLVMTQTVLGIPMPGIFLEVALHIATLLSVMIVYRRRLWQLVAGGIRGERDAWRYILLLAMATVPAAVVGFLFKEDFERAFDTPMVTGFMLLVTAGLLWSTRWAVRRNRSREPRHELDASPERAAAEGDGEGASRRIPAPDWLPALGMGVAQAFAILPGISRSGSTIAVGLWEGMDGEQAAEFSFLMSIPAIAGAAVLQVADAGQAMEGIGAATLAAGFIAALVSGVAAIKSLVWLVRRGGFHLFAGYVALVGIVFLVYLSA